MKNDNEERLIEFLVTIGTLIFFGFLSMYVLRGCSDEHSINGSLASPTAMGTVATTAIEETDVDNMEVNNSLEVDTDANLSLDNGGEVDVKANAVIASVTDGATLSQVDDNLSTDKNVKKDEVIESDSETTDKNATKDDNQGDKTKEIKDKTEAEEEAGIIADIKSGKLSSKPYVLKGIYFKTGSAVLSAKSKRQLDAIGKALKLHKDVIITLRGHTDKMGSSKKNELLSIKRAASVGYALVDRGANIDNIWTVGMGESEPITSNGSAKEMSKNRRVDIAVTK